jgi:hypothetical protein
MTMLRFTTKMAATLLRPRRSPAWVSERRWLREDAFEEY